MAFECHTKVFKHAVLAITFTQLLSIVRERRGAI